MKIDWPKRGHAYTKKDLFGLTNLLTNDSGLTDLKFKLLKLSLLKNLSLDSVLLR